MIKRIAFDLDETLGTPIIDIKSNSIIGFDERVGCKDILKRLKEKYFLILWTVSNRGYANKVLKYGLGKYFREVYTWNEIPKKWKDIRILNIDYLIDDSEYHYDIAVKYGIEDKYIIVPPYRSQLDIVNPYLWTQIVKKRING